MNLKIGAHLSSAGGFEKAVENITRIGGNCLQIFSTSPRMWRFPRLDEDKIKKFKAKVKEFSVEPVYFHASYLINLADAGETGKKSIQMLISELNLAAKLGIRGSVVHIGSFKKKEADYDLLTANIKSVLGNIPDDVFFIIENSGTRKIGRELPEIALIMDRLADDRVRVCLDTCHLFAAGVDVRDRERMEKYLQDFDRSIGLEYLELWHFNDSRDNLLGDLRDRHENIGQGGIGREGFLNLLRFDQVSSRPIIIETPGFDDQGPDKKNIDILKDLAAEI